MIERRDITGLTVAILGHAGLIALIYFWPWGVREEKPAAMDPIQVTLADDVGLVSAAPDPSDEPPAQAAQGEEAPPEPDAAPPEPQPEAKPDPAPKPQPKPDATDRHRPDRPSTQTPNAKPPRNTPQPTGQVSDPSKDNGPAKEPTNGTGTKSQATMTGEAQQNILSAIRRAVQPCADRQVIPAPEARQILAMVQLKLRPDGSLQSVQIVGHEGVNDSNERYVARVDDAVEAIFAGCTPIRGLPPELYDVPRGWRSMKFRYRLTS